MLFIVTSGFDHNSQLAVVRLPRSSPFALPLVSMRVDRLAHIRVVLLLALVALLISELRSRRCTLDHCSRASGNALQSIDLGVVVFGLEVLNQ